MEQVCGLARVAAAALSGQPASAPKPIDLALAGAHRIAPLLHIALGMDRPDLAALFDENAQAQAASRSMLLEIAALSAAKSFAWLVLNGEPQAERLYPDPAWCTASGIDLLVPPGQSHAIANTLRAAGWSVIPVRAPEASLGRAGLRTDPAIMLTKRVGKIALHERLFFAPGPIGDLLASDGARPRCSTGPDNIPAPELGAAMALDILLRGNARRWARLKWLLDLYAIMRRLDSDAQARLIAMIAQAGIEPLAVASLLTHRALLGGLPETVEIWLDGQAITPEITTRHAIHLEALAATAPTASEMLPFAGPTSARLSGLKRLFANRITRGIRARLARRTRKRGQYQRDPATRIDRYPLAFRFARDQLGDEAATRILSFGCSTGEEVFTLRRYFPAATLKGIEVDPARIRICRGRLGETGDSGISFQCATDASGEPPESHDAVFCMAVFRDPALDAPATRSTAGYISFDDFERGVADLVRCLKPGGLLFVEHSNFRIADTGSASVLEPVLHADPPRSANRPGLYGRDGCRLDDLEDLTLGYRKRLAVQENIE
ncbi:MAG: nucleotidyltransferase family protein [Sphingomonas bacterium]